ncbi:MAG: YgiQ family radical SAM protein [Christensenellales bacterium]|jgi:uncharacterized radical SAM protein YgiQ
MPFLPMNRKEMMQRGWSGVDFVYITGDAYVDHPSFGHAIISRVLEDAGYRVGIIAQPDWKDKSSIDVFGEPELGFLISGGNMDSMVNHYTVSRRRRDKDAYSPGGNTGLRPDYAAVVYGNLVRQTYKRAPVILGGVEASLRRLGHYDYWQNKVRRSILLDAQADLLIYGMGERAMLEVAAALRNGMDISAVKAIRGTVFKTKDEADAGDAFRLPAFEQVREDKRAYVRSFYTQYLSADPHSGRKLAEPYPGGIYVVQNPPQAPLTTSELDKVYDLAYEGTYHPLYEKDGGVPAIEEVKFSLTHSRGCFGACHFCALSFHQGRIVQSRSHTSVIREAEKMTRDPGFKGYIHDVGGPTANFRFPACKKQGEQGACGQKRCLAPKPCKNLYVDHSDYLSLLRKLRRLPGVKKVFIRSGIRFDYLMCDRDDAFMREMVQHHISGQLKVAPEHVSDPVLEMMGKPPANVYRRFLDKYEALNREYGKNQFVVPYLMSSHPGATLDHAVELAESLHRSGHYPQQVQDFYPTPSTLSTCMYYTGIDPRTGKEVYVAKHPREKAMQRALMQYRNPKNHALVLEALRKCGREDLIGFGKKHLIAPRPLAKRGKGTDNKGRPPGAGSAANKKRAGAKGRGTKPRQKTKRK